uniref:Uncharacterized protein n=1 Tax=Oryza meridionalis TaxID=40149 RepID=A0A0E0ELZ1_9ORYZ
MPSSSSCRRPLLSFLVKDKNLQENEHCFHWWNHLHVQQMLCTEHDLAATAVTYNARGQEENAGMRRRRHTGEVAASIDNGGDCERASRRHRGEAITIRWSRDGEGDRGGSGKGKAELQTEERRAVQLVDSVSFCLLEQIRAS